MRVDDRIVAGAAEQRGDAFFLAGAREHLRAGHRELETVTGVAAESPRRIRPGRESARWERRGPGLRWCAARPAPGAPERRSSRGAGAGNGMSQEQPP